MRGLIAVAYALGSPCAVQAAPKEPVCLNLADIASTKPNREGTSITFVLRDGKVLRNDLSKACPDLRMNGFSWSDQGGRVCENAQMIRVMNSGELCRLGRFIPVSPTQHH